MTDLLKNYAFIKGTQTKTSPENGNKIDKYECPECHEPVYFCNGPVVSPYFRHFRKADICQFYVSESELHLNAQFYLKQALQLGKGIRFHRNCNRCLCHFEMEIPPITDEDVDTFVKLEFSFKHNNIPRRADVAIVTDDSIDVIIEVCNKHPTKCDARPEPWFEVSAQEVVDTCGASNASVAEYLNFTCIRSQFEDKDETQFLCPSCEEAVVLKNDGTGTIYVKQRGAGCGKTYESIQLLKSPEFLEKRTFIYLSKMKSATTVIHNEIKQQIESGKLGDAVIVNDEKRGNQRRLSIRRTKHDSQPVDVVIGTVDAFTFAIRQQKDSVTGRQIQYFGGNMFEDIVADIAKGNMADLENVAVNFAGKPMHFTDNYLIVVDEAQDLTKEYLDAFKNVIERTNIDMYVIGDKLQSIMKEINLFTYLSETDNPRVMKDESSVNVVKRFHNAQFVDFVNRVVKFSDYGLPSIQGICDKCDGSCGYTHEDDVVPYCVDANFPDIFLSPDENFDNNNKIDRVENLMTTFGNSIRENVSKYGFLPNNFCFIFPIVSEHNKLLPILETFLQELWVEIFETPETYTELLLNNMRKSPTYWKSKLENGVYDERFYQYVYLHRSELNRPIDLTESEHSTRIMSIHASKGTGCECVFLCGLSQSKLTCFTEGIPNTLVYESLLHVGITRQKKQLYVGIEYTEPESGDICRRFNSMSNSGKKLRKIFPVNVSKLIEGSKLTKQLMDMEDLEFNKLVPAVTNESKTTVIDWGHHVIRTAVLRCLVNSYMLMNVNQSGSQLFALLKTLSDPEKTKIDYVPYREYKIKLINLQKAIIENIKNSGKGIRRRLDIPVLIFNPTTRSSTNDYTKLRDSIERTCASVVEKLQQRSPNLNFCVMESLIYVHLMDMSQRPFQTTVRILDIYRLFSYFVDVYNEPTFDQILHRQKFQCTCHEHFCRSTNTSSFTNKEVKKSIITHHMAVNRVQEIMVEYIAFVRGLTDINQLQHHERPEILLGYPIGIKSIVNFSLSSGTHFFGCIFRPQLNVMNVAETVANALLTQIILQQTKGNNTQIFLAIVTLDHNRPIFLNFSAVFKNHLLVEKLKLLLYQHTYNHFQKNNKPIAALGASERTKDERCKDNVSWMKDVRHKLIEQIQIGGELPQYIEEALGLCDREWHKLKKKEVTELEADIDYKLNDTLDYFIRRRLLDCAELDDE